MTKGQFFIIFSVLFGIFESVCCGNHSTDPFNFQLNQKTELENKNLSKEKILENPSVKKIIEKRRLVFDENNDLNSPVYPDREGEDNDYFARRRNNYSEPENEKNSDWGLRLQFPSPANLGNPRNFGDIQMKQPFTGNNNSPNHGNDWEKRTDILDITQSRWNEEKNFREFSNLDNRGRNHYSSRFGGEFNDNEMNREDRRGDSFNRRVSITTLNDNEMGNVKNYDERVGNIHSSPLGHFNKHYHNRNPNSFWSPNFYNPEKGVVINLNTECPAPRQFNNQLVHKFIFTPKSPVSAKTEYSSFQIPENSFIPSRKISPMYYL